MPATITVTTEADDINSNDGNISLREAIELSNRTRLFSDLSAEEQGHVSGSFDNQDRDVIAFGIGAGRATIKPQTPLPTITRPVIIDGSLQPGVVDRPLIEIDGELAGEGTDGLKVEAGNSIILGLVINRFKGNGIVLISQGGNAVAACFIGTDVSGTVPRPNRGDGIKIDNSSNNLIGGNSDILSNVISGNRSTGISIRGDGADGNIILRNYIGTAVGGQTDRDGQGSFTGNLQGGVSIGDEAAFNFVVRNVISGNRSNGVTLFGLGTVGRLGVSTAKNFILANMIGTNVTGDKGLGNSGSGVVISDAAYNDLGFNVISANGAHGVEILNNLGIGKRVSKQSTFNFIYANKIGTDRKGQVGLGNLGDGISINKSVGNVIGLAGEEAFSALKRVQSFFEPGPFSTGNVISGNGGNGISIVDVNARKALGVPFVGLPDFVIKQVQKFTASAQGVVGRKLFSNTIINNFIGTNYGGTSVGTKKKPLGNRGSGILLDRASDVLVGSGQTNAQNRNIISGNGSAGVEIRGDQSHNNLVLNNFIGTDFDGAVALGNVVGVIIDGALLNVVGGATVVSSNSTTPVGNLISGNSQAGIEIFNSGARDNLIQTNFIGTDITGRIAVGNRVGVLVNGVSSSIGASIVRNRIGGKGQEGNIISGNQLAEVYITGQNASATRVEGNYIGIGVSGVPLKGGPRRAVSGVLISDSSNNFIGGPGPFDVKTGFGNVIGRLGAGIRITGTGATSNLIRGNLVGIYPSAKNQRLGNTIGVLIEGAGKNVVGTIGGRNAISSNDTGIYLIGASATGNVILGNYVGLGSDGKTPRGNHVGIFLNGASNNIIGGTTPGAGNIIAGDQPLDNEGSIGIYLVNGAANNQVNGNTIGLDAQGRPGKNLAQGDYGVLLFNAANNPIAKGLGTNRVVGSGIANLREFTSAGAVPQGPAASTRSQATDSSQQLKTRSLPRRPGKSARIGQLRAPRLGDGR